MDTAISAAWIQAVTAITLAIFTVVTGWLFYQINQLHTRVGSLRDFFTDQMQKHEKDNREFREDMIDRLSRIEGPRGGRV